MFLEKRNESLKLERARRTKDYEERLNEEKVKSEKDSTLAFMNFIQTAEKDFKTLRNYFETSRAKRLWSSLSKKIDFAKRTQKFSREVTALAKSEAHKTSTGKLSHAWKWDSCSSCAKKSPAIRTTFFCCCVHPDELPLAPILIDIDSCAPESLCGTKGRKMQFGPMYHPGGAESTVVRCRQRTVRRTVRSSGFCQFQVVTGCKRMVSIVSKFRWKSSSLWVS